MNEVVFKTLKQKDFIVKSFVLKVATELNLSLSDTILLIYLSNQEIPMLDVENIELTTYLKQEQILESFQKLVTLGLIESKVEKNADGKLGEVISLDNLIQNVTQDITTGIKKKSQIDIYGLIEEEFGRPISSMEVSIIDKWFKEFEPDLIKEALKEAVYNNAKSLKYIESILNAWKEKGYKSINDIHKGMIEYSNNNSKNDLYDYNWVDED
ncbi:MAG: DnaD domain protein [Bacilli bacterium]|nr:DnaD domain protein [Bacilli bacterium]